MNYLKIKAALLLLSLSIGCDRTTVQTVETVTARHGSDRLIRRSWETVSFTNPDHKSYDSHSIVWQRLTNGSWTDVKSITQHEFQLGHPNRRWISQIHAFDPNSAIAIVKIAEGNVPEGSRAVFYTYSWRKWDVENNRELEFIRTCSDPFDAFTVQRLEPKE